MIRGFAPGRVAFLPYASGPHRRPVDILCYRAQDWEATIDNAKRCFKDTPDGAFPHAPRDVAKVPSRKKYDTNSTDDAYPEAHISTGTLDGFASRTKIQFQILQ